MKTYIYKSILVLLCLAMMFSIAGCSKQQGPVVDTETEEELTPIELLSTGSDFTPLSTFTEEGPLQGMQVVAENDRYQLLLDPATATVAVLVKATGYVWRSNLDEKTAETISNEDVMYEYLSQLIISYYNSQNTKVKYNSYQYGVLVNDSSMPTLKYYKLDNGLRVAYTIGQSIDYFYTPVILTEKYYNDLIGQMSAEDAESFSFLYEPLVYDEVSEEMIDSYKLTYKTFSKGDTFYMLDTNSRMVKSETYQLYLKGIVDDDYIDKAYEAAGYSYTRPDTPQFTLAMDYTLSDSGLKVNVPMDEVVYDENNFRLHSIQVLPFFGSVTDGAAGEMLLPDGSGALVDTSIHSESPISLPFYDTDESVWTVENAENMQLAALPAYGINRGTDAFVAYVSDGEALGSVECHPKTKVYPYAYIGSTFTTHPFETFASNGASASAVLQKYASDGYLGNITIDYMFASGQGLTYVDMAKLVQNYLFGGKEKLTDENLRFYLDTYGTVLRKENFLGYAYNKNVALTTFEQAKLIYDYLNEKQINNISVRYNNWYCDKYVNKISKIGKVEGAVGSKGEMKDFIAYVNEKGGTVYPNLELVMEKYSRSLADATWHSKFIEGTMISYSDNELYSEGVTADFERLVVKSNVIVEKINGILKKLNKLDVNAVALSTVGNRMFSDFTEDKVRYRDGVQDDMIKVLETIGQNNKVMVDGGNAYTLPYADDVMNLSMGCSNLSFEKAEVPFMQIVLHGYVSYAGNSMNLSDDYQMQLLKSVEYGANMAYTLNYATAEMVKNTNYSELYSTNFDHWKEKAAADFNAVAQVLNGCQNSTITQHKQLAKDVYMTEYDNGVAVVVNYGTTAYVHNGTQIDAQGFARVNNTVVKEG